MPLVRLADQGYRAWRCGYPYGFLDLRTVGYVQIATWSLIIAEAFVFFLLLIVSAAGHPFVARTAGTVSPLGGHWSPANQMDPDAVAVPEVIESMPAGADAVVQVEPL